ncbi:MAG: glutamate 5-kinase [Bacteroidales bacterium]
MDSRFRRIAVKVGSNVITQPDGSLNMWRISRLVEDIATLFKQGREVILITSGAVAAGRSEVTVSKKTDFVSSRQVLAAVGQVKLMAGYQFLFGKYGIPAGQVLATKESFGGRLRYLNMKNCISAMLENKVLPIVNENDTISVNELMFTDNDELSGMISTMMDCGSLIILSNIDGVFTGSPDDKESELIREIKEDSEGIERYITSSKSGSGRGGMKTKYRTARKTAAAGIDVYIANGTRDSIITDIVRHRDVPFTHIIAGRSRKSGVKKWLTYSDTFAKGTVTVNAGARDALLGEKASSLLMIGITSIEGHFKKGDIIRIKDENGTNIGVGKSEYDSEKARLHIGEKFNKPLVRYHFLVLGDSARFDEVN